MPHSELVATDVKFILALRVATGPKFGATVNTMVFRG